MTGTEMAPETLLYSPCNHLMRLLVQEYSTEFSRRKSFKLYCVCACVCVFIFIILWFDSAVSSSGYTEFNNRMISEQ
jgi:hypothetical protein